jgi:hypothetical protein
MSYISKSLQSFVGKIMNMIFLRVTLLYFQVANHWCSYVTFLQVHQVYMVHDSVELALEVVV